MVGISWADALDTLKPYIFKIITPRGHGSGFQISYSNKSGLVGVATAGHVIEHAYEWEEPIKLYHYESKKTCILRINDRVVFRNRKVDLAVILFNKDILPVKTDAVKLLFATQRLKQGIQVGWCGFPSIAPDDLCFFSGHVSSFLESQRSYLVDGVAINGVSGGPAFFVTESETNPTVYGVVTAYMPNRADGESLPGVCIIVSVQAYQAFLNKFKSMEEAKKEEDANEADKS